MGATSDPVEEEECGNQAGDSPQGQADSPVLPAHGAQGQQHAGSRRSPALEAAQRCFKGLEKESSLHLSHSGFY